MNLREDNDIFKPFQLWILFHFWEYHGQGIMQNLFWKNLTYSNGQTQPTLGELKHALHVLRKWMPCAVKWSSELSSMISAQRLSRLQTSGWSLASVSDEGFPSAGHVCCIAHCTKHKSEHSWLIHVNVWQKPLQYCKVISLQLIKINEKKKSEHSCTCRIPTRVTIKFVAFTSGFRTLSLGESQSLLP